MESNATPQPGQTVTPSGTDADLAPEAATEPADVPQTPDPALAPSDPPSGQQPDTPPPDAPQPDAPEAPEIPETPNAPDTGDTARSDGTAPDHSQEISWTASEFIAHAKSFGWYAALAMGAAAFAAAVFLVTHDFISVSVVLIAALILGVYAGHQPKQLRYRIDSSGLTIGQKHLGYNEFRSFSVLAEGAFSSIVFMPLKRFAAPTTIYYPPEEEDKIVGMLSNRLPLEERDHDAVDRLMHRIRY